MSASSLHAARRGGSGVGPVQITPPAADSILVAGRKLDREIPERAGLTRQEPPGYLLLSRQNGGRAAAVVDVARGESHLAGAAAAASAPEHDAGPRSENGRKHGV